MLDAYLKISKQANHWAVANQKPNCVFIWVGVIHVVPLHIVYKINDTGFNSSPMRSSNQVHPVRFDNIWTLGPLPVEYPRFLSAKLVKNCYACSESSISSWPQAHDHNVITQLSVYLSAWNISCLKSSAGCIPESIWGEIIISQSRATHIQTRKTLAIPNNDLGSRDKRVDNSSNFQLRLTLATWGNSGAIF